LLGLNPGKASFKGLLASQIVSPTLVSDKFLILLEFSSLISTLAKRKEDLSL